MSKHLLDANESRNALRIDGSDNDSVIEPLLNAIPLYMEQATGYKWDTHPIDPLAKTTAGFILQLWYNPQDNNIAQLQRTIETLLIALSVKGKQL